MRMIRYVDHVAITVKDLDRSAEFYTKLGFSVLREAETPSLKIMFVGNELAQLELFEVKERPAKEVPPLKDNEIGIKHICFHVEDLGKVVKEMKRKGVEFTSEIRKSGERSHVFFKDPDGVVLQLLQG